MVVYNFLYVLAVIFLLIILYSVIRFQRLLLPVRVNDIMEKDSNKDPASNPNALLAKVLIGQVVLFCHFSLI